MRRCSAAFICTKNAFRSQIAEEPSKAPAQDVIEALSGGSRPADRVDPLAVDVMAESRIRVSASRPKSLQDKALRSLDLIVHTGCDTTGTCPNVPGVPNDEEGIPNPGGGLEQARSIRDEIRAKVDQLAARLRSGEVVAQPEFKLEL